MHLTSSSSSPNHLRSATLAVSSLHLRQDRSRPLRVHLHTLTTLVNIFQLFLLSLHLFFLSTFVFFVTALTASDFSHHNTFQPSSINHFLSSFQRHYLMLSRSSTVSYSIISSHSIRPSKRSHCCYTRTPPSVLFSCPPSNAPNHTIRMRLVSPRTPVKHTSRTALLEFFYRAKRLSVSSNHTSNPTFHISRKALCTINDPIGVQSSLPMLLRHHLLPSLLFLSCILVRSPLPSKYYYIFFCGVKGNKTSKKYTIRYPILATLTALIVSHVYGLLPTWRLRNASKNRSSSI